MKILIALLLFCISLLINGCMSYPSGSTSDTDNSSSKYCPESVNGFQFSYPKGFNECGKDGRDTVFFRRNNNVEEVLLIHAKKIDTLPEKYIKLKSQNHDLTIYNYQHRNCQIVSRDDLLFDFCIDFLEQAADANYPDLSDSLEEQFDENQVIEMILNIKVVPEEPLGETTGPASENFIECEDSILGVKFKYPDNWTACYVSPEKDKYGAQNIRFEQMYDGNKVWLEARIGKSTKEQGFDPEIFFTGEEGKLHDLGSLKIITNIACGGGVGCPRFSIDDDVLFSTFWDIGGEEESLKYPMGIYKPSSYFTEENILNILKSVQRVE